MNKNLNIKINGSNLKSLFFALHLIRIDSLNIHLSLTNNSNCFKEKFYTITEYTKTLLEKLQIWEKIEPKLHGIESFSFYSDFSNEEISFGFKEFPNIIKHRGSICWILKHEDLKNILLNKLSEKDNLYFLENIDDQSFKEIYNYDLYFKESKANFKRSYKDKFLKNDLTSHTLIFKVLVRGNTLKRAYKNFLNDETLLMLPLEKNIYQIIWTSNTNKSKYRFNLNENLLLDNLSTILPNGFSIDQIIGDINIFSDVSFFYNSFRVENNTFIYEDFKNFYKDISNNELNIFLKDLNILFDHKKLEIDLLRNLKYKYYLKKLVRNSSLTFIKNISLRIYFVLISKIPFINKLFKFIFCKIYLYKFKKIFL
tara:strand:+ start:1583 stop:2689 length:1107 start_codon:yes stop_codon:yes gene_type:complete